MADGDNTHECESLLYKFRLLFDEFIQKLEHSLILVQQKRTFNSETNRPKLSIQFYFIRSPDKE